MGRDLVFDENKYSPSDIKKHLKEYFKERFGLDAIHINVPYKVDHMYRAIDKQVKAKNNRNLAEFYMKAKDITPEKYKEMLESKS